MTTRLPLRQPFEAMKKPYKTMTMTRRIHWCYGLQNGSKKIPIPVPAFISNDRPDDSATTGCLFRFNLVVSSSASIRAQSLNQEERHSGQMPAICVKSCLDDQAAGRFISSSIPCKWAAAISMSLCLYWPALLSAESTAEMAGAAPNRSPHSDGQKSPPWRLRPPLKRSA